MHDDVKILAVSAASALSAVIGALLVAHWIVKPIDELRVASRKLAGGELSARAPAARAPDRTAGARGLIQRHGDEHRGRVRRPPPARRLGEPRPPNPHRSGSSNARGSRGRAGDTRRVPPCGRRTDPRALPTHRRPLRTRLHRRWRAHSPTATGTTPPRRRRVPARGQCPGTCPQRPPRSHRRPSHADDRGRTREGRTRAHEPPHKRTPTHTQRRNGRGHRRAKRTRDRHLRRRHRTRTSW